MKTYEWAVIGSGIAGISIAEILTRQGHSVVLVEKNDTLASETTRDFHEWLHTGSLYTLVPDRLITLRFILGAIDDLIEFYSSFLPFLGRLSCAIILVFLIFFEDLS